MQLAIHPTADLANAAATDLLAEWLSSRTTQTVMLAAGNTPLELYRRLGERKLPLSHLTVFALDEYVGVPLNEPRNCANLIRRTAIQPWGVPESQYHTVSSLLDSAAESVRRHEDKISATGGLDVLILGLGQNGHLGFNEPGSAEDSMGRVLDLETISIEANRKWFGGDYAPRHGVTVGIKTILAARKIIILAFGSHKTTATTAMIEGPRHIRCPASLLQGHPNVRVFLDPSAASQLAAR